MAVNYDVIQTVEGGIERITYKPHQPQHETPIIMQHGMWHGAWCWQPWQKALAERGWESHAHSLPGHGQSPTRRPIRWCTLGYYLRFLRAEIERQPRKPILMGHSMGGALTQWYIKKVADDLPAAVLVASWSSHEMFSSMWEAGRRDRIGVLLMTARLTATPALRNPRVTAEMLISKNAIYTPEELQARVGPESMWVLLQYNPLQWQPKQNPRTPLLWLIPDADLAVVPAMQARSAAFYGADIIHVPGAGHNLMMESTHEQIAESIHEWMVKQVG
jgi:pimeloyl-ACP methyl ester carboxylesterase